MFLFIFLHIFLLSQKLKNIFVKILIFLEKYLIVKMVKLISIQSVNGFTEF